LISAGIISRWISMTKIKIRFEEIGPQILTWEHLRLGFAACAICFFIAFLVFLCEICQPKVKTFIVKLTVFSLVKSFLDSNRLH